MRGVRHDLKFSTDSELDRPVRQGADFYLAFQLYDELPTPDSQGRFTDLTGLTFRSQFRAGGVAGDVELEVVDADFIREIDEFGEPWVVLHRRGHDPERSTDTRRMTAAAGAYDIEVVDGTEVREVLYGDYDLAYEATRLE
ncbi:hypothetical protein DAETH_29030 [Deinococcus aetherius]|uniref:Uncharacterized protein n=1 Tax=Deinococcus aetherius TaxID=200252 RepID=A0ABM8AGK8_9DEIO|nr:hypothetical protein [Deinococcus aetherius]BDP42934.1 hypothetical protein DAETH_29030 [Deinococcus aetherius]